MSIHPAAAVPLSVSPGLSHGTNDIPALSFSLSVSHSHTHYLAKPEGIRCSSFPMMIIMLGQLTKTEENHICHVHHVHDGRTLEQK